MPKKLTKYSRENRKHKTSAELRLWKLLIKWGIKFRSQRAFDYYIVDFLIFERRLIIEVDGGYHLNQPAKDKKRQNYLENLGLGLKVLRITNEEVLNTDCERLKKEILAYPVIPYYDNGRAFWLREHKTF